MSAITLEIFGTGDSKAGYIGWSPVRLKISGTNPTGAKSVVLRSSSLDGSVSRVVFIERFGAAPQDEFTVNLGPSNEVEIFVAGKFQPGKPHNGASPDSKDVVVEAAWANQPAQVSGSLDLMIRVRKNANQLSEKARTDFLNALATLNGIKTGSDPTPGPGKGVYVTDFVGMHVAGASNNEHGDSMFLPWHRLYLLDLERLLQQVNPAVTLPYWRFDQPAPNLFSEDFIGATESIPSNSPFTPGVSDKRATFSSTNPLSQWKIGEVNGISRAAFFDTQSKPASGLPAGPNRPAFQLINQLQTLALGGSNGTFGAKRTQFSAMEGTPHGAAHVSFNGPINFVPEAPKDPLFFLLHCNVDRLWGLWQFTFKRDVANDELSYPYQDDTNTPNPWKVINAQQWPWENSLSQPGQLKPPGVRKGNFTQSPTGKPISGNVPAIVDAIDASGQHDPQNYLGFAFDDVPFDYDRASALIA